VVPLGEATVNATRAAGLNTLILGLRPESFFAADIDDGLKLEVMLYEELGADAYVYGRLAGDSAGDKHFVVRYDGRVTPSIGDVVRFGVRAGEDHVFHPDTGTRIG
jgi:multiple sugar transport system ATP-binding protein